MRQKSQGAFDLAGRDISNCPALGNTRIVVDMKECQLIDLDGNVTIDWDGRSLVNSDGVTVLDWDVTRPDPIPNCSAGTVVATVNEIITVLEAYGLLPLSTT